MIQELIKKYKQSGVIRWISIRPIKKATPEPVTEVEVNPESGLIGDHYQGRNGNRQVTLIQSEHLNAVASFLDRKEIEPSLTRRNIVVTGINLHSLKDKQFRIGSDVILEHTGECHPCSRMEENLGTGGYNAMRGHGGITAKVIHGGMIRLGDKLTPIT